ncbi:secretin N-terminal domain-containing protein [Cerasicoccus maritimus]|uniref:secretin N-terminal domain-containing protein n=1 Tax=Cerasicoccus maritimus TaxID=490089 RepID=UPI002852D846|nr:secretin N-terminal domain-containing protein [Cerasicoccus maritimus]
MRIPLILLVLLGPGMAFAATKMEVFELQNRDAESLVPVIASALGPESRVTADPRTNSLIVSYPAEMKENLHTIMQQLDRAEPNIVVEVTTLDVETAYLVQLGISGRNGLSPKDYQLVLPLLIESKQAVLGSQQRVVTKNNLPAQISLQSGPSYTAPDKPRRSATNYVNVTPRSQGDNIELKLAHASASLVGGKGQGQGSIFATSTIPDGGALMFTFNESEDARRQAAIPIIPLGLERSGQRAMQRIVLLHAQTDDYKQDDFK